MEIITLARIERHYKNNGQHAEQVVRYTLTGEICKADNKPATKCGDVLDIQIKSNQATICHGTDLKEHIKTDAAERYGYVFDDFSKMALMSIEEYVEFIAEFGYIDRDSRTKKEKIRVRASDRQVARYIEVRA